MAPVSNPRSMDSYVSLLNCSNPVVHPRLPMARTSHPNVWGWPASSCHNAACEAALNAVSEQFRSSATKLSSLCLLGTTYRH